MSEVKVLNTLTGSISAECSLTGTISVPENGTGNYESYTGDYEVVPQAFEETVLPTANKMLSKDVVVAKVPYIETSNTSNGITVYIAATV